MKKLERQPLEFYLQCNYPVTLYQDPDGGYVAEIKDLSGCITQGETADEAITNIEDARRLWIETAYEYGDNIPLPSTESQYSGKVLLRMPRLLHQQLAENAELEGVSLNQYIVSLLSGRNALKAVIPMKQLLEKIYNRLFESLPYHFFVAKTKIPNFYEALDRQGHELECHQQQLLEALKKMQSSSELPSERLLTWLTRQPNIEIFSKDKNLNDVCEQLAEILEVKLALEKQAEDFMEKIQSQAEELKK